MSTNNHEVWANSTTPLFLQNPAYSITLAGTPTNVVLTNSNGQLAVNGAIQTATSLWSTFPATSNTIFMDATTSNKITNIGSNLYFAGNLIASAGDISNVGNWSLYNAVSDVNLSNVGSNYSIVGAKNITAISNVITPVVIAPNNLSVSATSNLTQFCGTTLSNNAPTIASSFSNTYSILGDKGVDYTDFCYTTLSNKGGKGGQINLVADGGQVNIGGTNYGIGGLINITANSPSVFPYNATSAIKLSGASILSYAGAVSPLGSLAGYNYIQATLGVNIVAGSASSLPNTPGTIYMYGANGTKIQNTLYVDVLNNYTGSNLNIQANNGTQNVNISNTQAIYMQNNPIIDGGSSGSNRRIFNFDRIASVAFAGDSLNSISGDLTLTSSNFLPFNYNINLNSQSNINLNSSNGGTTNISSLKLLGTLNANAQNISNVGNLKMSPGVGYIDILGSAVVASGTSSALVLASNSRLTGQVDLLLEAGGNLNITNLVQATFKTSGSINSFNVGGRNYLDINAPNATSVPGALRLQGNAGGLYFAENCDLNMPNSNYITINQYGTGANSYFQMDNSRNIVMGSGNNTIIEATSNTYLRGSNEVIIQNQQGKYITINQYGGVGANSYIQFDPGKNITMRAGNDTYISAVQDTYLRSDRDTYVQALQGNNLILGHFGGTGANSYMAFNTLKDITLQSYRYLTLVGQDPATGSNSSIQIADNGDILSVSRRNLAMTTPTGTIYLTAPATGTSITLTSPEIINEASVFWVQQPGGYTNGAIRITTDSAWNYLQSSARPLLISGIFGANPCFSFNPTGSNISYKTLDMNSNPISNVSTLNGHNLYQYAEWASTASTTLTANTPLPITWDTGILSAGFTPVSGGTYLACTLAGNYAIVCSIVLQKSAGSGSTGAVYAWIETTGGVQVGNSARHIDVPTGETNEITLNQIIPLTAGQTFRIMVASDVGSVSLLNIPAQTTPYARPQVPSANLSILIVS